MRSQPFTLNTHFYIVKQGKTGVHTTSPYALKHNFKIIIEAALASTFNQRFEQKSEKFTFFSSENLSLLKYTEYLENHQYKIFIANNEKITTTTNTNMKT